MNKYAGIAPLAQLLLAGCTGVNIPDNLVTGPPLGKETAKGAPNRALLQKCPRLEAAYWQIKGVNQTLTNASVREEARLPAIFAQDPVVSKMVIAAREALSEGKAHPAAISRSDMKKTARMLQQNFGVACLNSVASRNVSTRSADENKTAFVIAQAYLYKYFVDPNGFIDRAGTKYVAPEFSGTVANPEITAAVGILLEAVYDSLLDTPVWVDDKGNAVTKTESTPTALALKYASPETLKDGAGHIDQDKLNVMNFLAGMAGTQSKTVAGMAFRWIGKVNIGFAVEGGLSFGDNQTLAQILDTTFQTSAQRLTMEALIPIFRRIDGTRGSYSLKPADSEDGVAREALFLMGKLPR